MANIRVTPETLSSQGENLVDYAGDLSDLVTQIDSKVNEIIDGWDGLAQDGYYEMYSTMKESLDKFPDLVNALGEATKAAADAFATVDEELKAGFTQG